MSSVYIVKYFGATEYFGAIDNTGEVYLTGVFSNRKKAIEAIHTDMADADPLCKLVEVSDDVGDYHVKTMDGNMVGYYTVDEIPVDELSNWQESE